MNHASTCRTGWLQLLFGILLLLSPAWVWAASPAGPVPKTGQTTIKSAGDDGDFQKGIPWPNPRFTDNSDGTIRDNLTNLVWMKNANCWGTLNWSTALTKIQDLNGATATPATCTGYTGTHKDWRLPDVRELKSLIDLSHTNPALPTGHPFTGVQSYYYWSSTTNADGTSNAWSVHLYYGYGYFDYKTYYDHYVWPVRGG